MMTAVSSGFKDCFLLEAGTYKFYLWVPDATTENNIYEFES